jgi:hypothetical protein
MSRRVTHANPTQPRTPDNANPVPKATYQTRLRLLRVLTRKELEALADTEWRPHHMDRLTLTHRLARWWDDGDMRKQFTKLLDRAK